MHALRCTLTLALIAAALTGTAHAQTLYKSVDASGKVVYSDQPPASGAVQKTLKLESLPVSVVPGNPLPPTTPGQAPVEAQKAAQPRGEVTLYMATWCGYCKAAKAYLGGKGIAYREFDVDTPTGKAAFAQLGARGVPVLLTNGQRVAGFSTQSYDAVFASRK
ncbi:glutaredoxin domain-containing protein [Acidovorax sp. A1169]|nr:glutaredoxin domain-containing protein [Acidovorax sp. A1169]MDP4076095.1 glutaredoxin domain-containing protein [Acidovorax sp. A1169]